MELSWKITKLGLLYNQKNNKIICSGKGIFLVWLNKL